MRLTSRNVDLTGTFRPLTLPICPEGQRGWTGKSGFEFLLEGLTGPDGEPLDGGICAILRRGGEVQAAFGPRDETLSIEAREGHGGSSGH